MRSAKIVAALFAALLLVACSPSVESPPVKARGLSISRQSDATFQGSPAAHFDVELSRTPAGTISVDATLTNSTPATFTTSVNELLSVSADGKVLFGAGNQAFGGDAIAPHETRTWHLDLNAPRDGVVAITAANWFVPRAELGDGVMDWGSVEVTASLRDLPVIP